MDESKKSHIEKWEAKKRQKMGDVRFFKKHISLYEKLDKANKILFPIIVCLCLMILTWRLIFFIIDFNFENLFFVLVSFMLFASWILICYMYYRHVSYNMYGKNIERWKEELNKTLNEAQMQ